MYREWAFFKTLVDNAQLALRSADLLIAARLRDARAGGGAFARLPAARGRVRADRAAAVPAHRPARPARRLAVAAALDPRAQPLHRPDELRAGRAAAPAARQPGRGRGSDPRRGAAVRQRHRRGASEHRLAGLSGGTAAFRRRRLQPMGSLRWSLSRLDRGPPARTGRPECRLRLRCKGVRVHGLGSRVHRLRSAVYDRSLGFMRRSTFESCGAVSACTRDSREDRTLSTLRRSRTLFGQSSTPEQSLTRFDSMGFRGSALSCRRIPRPLARPRPFLWSKPRGRAETKRRSIGDEYASLIGRDRTHCVASRD